MHISSPLSAYSSYSGLRCCCLHYWFFCRPDKLLYCVGDHGSGDGDFSFPRGLATDVGGDIIVADTKNHRLQFFNQCGVYKSRLGGKGRGEGQFNEPIGVAVMFNGDFAVADRRNKRVQVFDSEFNFKFAFGTVDPPFYVACDDDYAIIVSTEAGTVEVYRRQGKLWQRFSVGTSVPCPVAVNEKQEVIVADIKNNMVKFYTYTGKLLYQFQPVGSAEGLACSPTGLCLNPVGQILITDGLNHTVNLYTERGALVEQLVGPTDDAGSGQACAVGPEGHLVTTEFTTNGAHCLKIFRYRDCECHKQRPNSSKKSTRSDTAALF